MLGALRDIAMDVCIASCTKKTGLTDAADNPDHTAIEKEKHKFEKDDKSCVRLQSSSTIRFVPLCANQFGRRGPHFEALLTEFAAELVSRPAGCRLLNGPYKQTYKQALTTIRKRWGARITWMLQREHAAQIVKAQEDLARYQEGGAAASAGPSMEDLD